jgi:hypothetical protein
VPSGYGKGVKRLELVRVRVCKRCGRGGAELRSSDGDKLVVPLDPVWARELQDAAADGVRSLTELVLSGSGISPGEVVLDVDADRLRALFAFTRDGDSDVVSCPAGEGIALAVRGSLNLYATDEALAHAAARQRKSERKGGSETIH